MTDSVAFVALESLPLAHRLSGGRGAQTRHLQLMTVLTDTDLDSADLAKPAPVSLVVAACQSLVLPFTLLDRPRSLI